MATSIYEEFRGASLIETPKRGGSRRARPHRDNGQECVCLRKHTLHCMSGLPGGIVL